jgi:hypothetical protein
VGLFGNKTRDEWVEPSEPSPIKESDIDISTAVEVTAQLCQAVGDHNRMSVATASLMAASGMPDPNHAMAWLNAIEREGRSATTKLWRWLVAAARAANSAGKPEVAVLAYYWATEWIHYIQPGLPPNASIQLGFDKAPPEIYPALVHEAHAALEELPEDTTLAFTAQGQPVTTSLRSVVAEQVQMGGDMSPQTALVNLVNQAR